MKTPFKAGEADAFLQAAEPLLNPGANCPGWPGCSRRQLWAAAGSWGRAGFNGNPFTPAVFSAWCEVPLFVR